jgi:hypothetical protein
VQFFRDGKKQPFATVTLDATGHASVTISLDPGQHTIAASYSGDANYNSSSGSLTQTASRQVPLVPAGAAGTTSATSSFAASVVQALVVPGGAPPAAAAPAPAAGTKPAPAAGDRQVAAAPPAPVGPPALPAAAPRPARPAAGDSPLDQLFGSSEDG